MTRQMIKENSIHGHVELKVKYIHFISFCFFNHKNTIYGPEHFPLLFRGLQHF